MKPRFKFQKNYFILTVVLFIVEVLIALYVHDNIVRPYIGDFIVVILLYCFFKSFWNISEGLACLLVLIIAYIIEFLQYLNLLQFLGLQNSRLAAVLLGSSFEWIDMIAYTAGVLFVWFLEKLRAGRQHKFISASK